MRGNGSAHATATAFLACLLTNDVFVQFGDDLPWSHGFLRAVTAALPRASSTTIWWLVYTQIRRQCLTPASAISLALKWGACRFNALPADKRSSRRSRWPSSRHPARSLHRYRKSNTTFSTYPSPSAKLPVSARTLSDRHSLASSTAARNKFRWYSSSSASNCLKQRQRIGDEPAKPANTFP